MSSAVPIAVVPREVVEMTIGLRDGFWRGTALQLAALEASVVWMPRDAAELDPSYKQLIPYVVVRRGDDWFATERLRGGTESRLHGRISLGVGGHVEVPEPGRGAIECGLLREWTEEVDCSTEPAFAFEGFVNDDSIEVGRVHVGLVYSVTLGDAAELRVRETEKLEGAFRPMEWLEPRWERLETWSRFVASGLSGRALGGG